MVFNYDSKTRPYLPYILGILVMFNYNLKMRDIQINIEDEPLSSVPFRYHSEMNLPIEIAHLPPASTLKLLICNVSYLYNG